MVALELAVAIEAFTGKSSTIRNALEGPDVVSAIVCIGIFTLNFPAEITTVPEVGT